MLYHPSCRLFARQCFRLRDFRLLRLSSFTCESGGSCSMYQRPWDIESKASKAGCSRNIRYVEKCARIESSSDAYNWIDSTQLFRRLWHIEQLYWVIGRDKLGTLKLPWKQARLILWNFWVIGPKWLTTNKWSGANGYNVQDATVQWDL
jgi:hypothetical protein